MPAHTSLHTLPFSVACLTTTHLPHTRVHLHLTCLPTPACLPTACLHHLFTHAKLKLVWTTCLPCLLLPASLPACLPAVPACCMPACLQTLLAACLPATTTLAAFYLYAACHFAYTFLLGGSGFVVLTRAAMPAAFPLPLLHTYLHFCLHFCLCLAACSFLH